MKSSYRSHLGTALLFSIFATADAFAQAQSSPAATPSLGEVFSKMMPMFLMVFFIFYVLVLRPQNQKLKDHQEMLKNLKKGDEVLTSSGIYGKLSSLEGDVAIVEIAPGAKAKFQVSHLAKKIVQEESAKDKA